MKKPIAVLALSLLGFSSTFAQQNIVSFSSINPNDTMNEGGSYTLGYEFEVTTPITVTGLSAFTDNPGTGLSENIPVGLWNSSQTKIASAMVRAGTGNPLTSDGLFRYATLSTPLTLSVGTYYVGAEFANGLDDYTFDVNGLSAITGVTYVESRSTTSLTLAFPDDHNDAVTAGTFGGNVVVAAVPEPESIRLLCVGLAGLMASRRRKLL